MAVLADDEVVVNRDAKRTCDLHDRLRHLDVGAGGRRITRGMVVHEASKPPIAMISLTLLHVETVTGDVDRGM